MSDMMSYSSKSTRKAGNRNSNNDGGASFATNGNGTAESPYETTHSTEEELYQDQQPDPTDKPSSSTTQQQQGQDEAQRRKYSLTELIAYLNQENADSAASSNNDVSNLPPELSRRVMDFRLAQQKRFQKHGPTQKWGIYGLYLHLSNVRTDLEWAEDAAWRRQQGKPYLSWSDFDQVARKGFSNKPWFTYALMAICTVMMVVEFAVNDWSMEPLDVNPLFGPSAETLVTLGALDTPKIVNDGQWWRLFSPVILHAGLIHWVVNMLALWFFGIAIEQSHGLANSLLMFWVPAVGGNILSAIFLPQYISVGASGGIFGFIGACLADITVNWNLLFIQDVGDDNAQAPWKRNAWAFFWIIMEMAVNIVLGLTPFIDNFIHLGGLLYGMCCGWTVIEYTAVNFFGYDATFWTKVRLYTFRFLGLIISVVCIIVTCAWLATFEEDNNPCPNCRYFNCVETPWWHCDDCDFVTADLYRTETNADQEGTYTRIDLTCPNGDLVESIDVSASNTTDRDEIRDQLPDYCRDYCPEVFATS